MPHMDHSRESRLHFALHTVLSRENNIDSDNQNFHQDNDTNRMHKII